MITQTLLRCSEDIYVLLGDRTTCVVRNRGGDFLFSSIYIHVIMTPLCVSRTRDLKYRPGKFTSDRFYLPVIVFCRPIINTESQQSTLERIKRDYKKRKNVYTDLNIPLKFIVQSYQKIQRSSVEQFYLFVD